MKKSILIFLSLSVLGTSCVKEMQEGGSDLKNSPHQSKMTGNLYGEKTEGELLVKLTENSVRSLAEGTFDSASIFGGLEDASLTPVFPTSEDDGSARHSLYKWHKLSFSRSISPEEAAEIIAGQPEIEAIQYNSIIKTDQCPVSIEYVPEPATKSTRASGLPFNDRGLGTQWNLINDGSIDGAAAGADVGVKDAWRLTAGDPRVIVAVFDQGIAHTHPDLEKSMWRNTREINGKTGVDDDKNGYIDDKYGYNFVTDNGTLTYAKGTPDHPGDHGTHVAGTIAAVNNNGIGVSSIAGGSGKGDGVRLMSCQISPTGTGGFATAENVAKAFKYAADMGACIAQCSFGDANYESVVQEALRYFIAPENSNCAALETNIIVFSAGNYNSSRSLYPGALPECISVTAICHDFLPAGYSNYGAGCDIAAPGGDIVRGSNNAPCMILSTGIGSEYGDEDLTWVYKYGTSMACPHVSGVVALGASYALELGKKFSRDGFISRLLASAKEIDSYNTGNVTKLMYENRTYKNIDISVKKGRMGTGAVDAWNFLMALEGTPSFLTVPGRTLTIDLADCVGESYEKYSLIVPSETADALGLSGTSEIKDGKLELTCTRTGAGKILLKASVGKDASGNIPELDYNMEISIVSRQAVAQNGGWL